LNIRVLLADDHLVVLKGIAVFLDQEGFHIIGEASNGLEAVELAKSLQPDVVVMDIHMPQMDGIQACRKIIEQNPAPKVVLFTSTNDPVLIQEALQAGAAGYMLKHSEPEQLAQAIRGAHQGIIQLHSDLLELLLVQRQIDTRAGSPVPAPTIEILTPREREVLQLIAHGMSNKEIAEKLVVAEKTVKTHVSSILSKLHLTDRTQAAIYAVRSATDDQPCDCD